MDPFGPLDDSVQIAAEALRQRGASFWDVFLQSLRLSTVEIRSSLRGSCFETERSDRTTNLIEGIGLRLMDRGLVGFAATADLSLDGLRRALGPDTLVLKKIAAGADPVTRSAPLSVDDPLNRLAAELLDTCITVHDRVTSAQVHISVNKTRRLVVSEANRPLSDFARTVELRGLIVCQNQQISAVKTLRDGESEDIHDLISSLGKHLMEKADQLSPRGEEIAGDHSIVLSPGWGAVWLHEAVGHQLEADSIEAGHSVFSNSMGSKIAAEQVTIVDNPLADGGRVRQAFDDEGVSSQETVLIESGRLVGILSDRQTANSTGHPLTGNGRRGHYAQLPRPRTTNLLLLPGRDSPEALLEGVERGIHVTDVKHAWYEPDSRSVYLHVVEAQLIEKGHLTARLAPLILTADAQSVLAGIAGVGHDFASEPDRGYCSKGGVTIPVGVGQPTVLINSMTARPVAQ